MVSQAHIPSRDTWLTVALFFPYVFPISSHFVQSLRVDLPHQKKKKSRSSRSRTAAFPPVIIVHTVTFRHLLTVSYCPSGLISLDHHRPPTISSVLESFYPSRPNSITSAVERDHASHRRIGMYTRAGLPGDGYGPASASSG
jgi:energy-converting hydrogenase Eha subunit A